MPDYVTSLNSASYVTQQVAITSVDVVNRQAAGLTPVLDATTVDATNPFNPFGVTLDASNTDLIYRRFVEEEEGRGTDFSAMLPRFEHRRRGS